MRRYVLIALEVEKIRLETLKNSDQSIILLSMARYILAENTARRGGREAESP